MASVTSAGGDPPGAVDRGGSVLVTGATGPHGGTVVEALRIAGWRVRALTRDPLSPRARTLVELGAEPIAGDLVNSDSLVDAMRGVDAAYAVTTPFAAGAHEEVRQGESLVAAAEEANLPWLILGSVASADRETGVPHFESKARIERRLRASSVPHTIIAPTYFFENVGDLVELAGTGEIVMPLPASHPLQQVSLRDLGALVAAVLSRPTEFVGERVEVAADQPTPQEMAEALSRRGTRPVRYRRIDIEEVAARSTDLAAMYRFLEQTGYDVDIAALRDRFPAMDWTTFADWARREPQPKRTHDSPEPRRIRS